MRLTHIFPVAIRKRGIKLYSSIFWPIYFKKYLKIIESDRVPSKRLIRNLVYSWGNGGYSAQLNYIETLVEYANATNLPIFECGSGLSTLLLGAIAKKRGIKMVSVEHHHEWAKKVQDNIDKFTLTNNELLISELMNYGDFEWYNIEKLNISEMGLCICDAPPGNTYGGRKGFLYLFKDIVKKGTVILVDDTIREAEHTMIKEWKNILPFKVIFIGDNDPHAILTIQ